MKLKHVSKWNYGNVSRPGSRYEESIRGRRAANNTTTVIVKFGYKVEVLVQNNGRVY